MNLDTRIDLVKELEKLPKSPEIDFMIEEARSGEYHDFKNKKYVCGKMESATRLDKLGYHDLANRIKNGDFDEEADEKDKKEMMEALTNSFKNPKLKKRKSGPFPNMNKHKSKSSMPMPRIRGRAVQKSNRSWGWEAEIIIGDATNSIHLNSGESEFLNFESAKEDLSKHAYKISDIIAKDVFKAEPSGYFDLVNNKFIPKSPQ